MECKKERYKGYNLYYFEEKFFEIGKKIIDKNYKEEKILKNTKRNFVEIISVNKEKKKLICVYPPKGGKYGVDHLVWSPMGKNIKILFCRDKESSYDEIDINTFDFEEFKKVEKELENGM